MLDRVKLAKLLAMTTSKHDGEALNAIRMANALLAVAKMTWEEALLQQPATLNVVLSRTPYQADENWTPPHLKDSVIIDLMFRTIYAQPRVDGVDFWSWLDDAHEKWQKHGALTQGQYDGLKRSYHRAKRNAS